MPGVEPQYRVEPSIGATTVIDFPQRARLADMSWPPPEDMTDEALEAVVSGRAARDQGATAPVRLAGDPSRAAPEGRDAAAALRGAPCRASQRFRPPRIENIFLVRINHFYYSVACCFLRAGSNRGRGEAINSTLREAALMPANPSMKSAHACIISRRSAGIAPDDNAPRTLLRFWCASWRSITSASKPNTFSKVDAEPRRSGTGEGRTRCQRATESPQFWARNIPHFWVGDQPLA
jgi:hypothetical protein